MSAVAGDKVVRKYLAHYAEHTALSGASAQTWSAWAGETFDHVLVIPAYDEGEGLDRAIGSVPVMPDRSSLVVVVVNEREDSPRAVRDTNRQTLRRLHERFDGQCGADEATTLCRTPFGALVTLHIRLPSDQGVGLARKHGADFALGAWAAGRISSPWIHCSDADVQLPGDYFCEADKRANVGLHRFRHLAVDEDSQAAARTYDLWLRVHALGLHWAGSPYGFHSIGSTISVNAHAYAAVRGFPRRNAGEDFYFLNKLAKLGSLTTVNDASHGVVPFLGAPLRIAARVSERVPFGTGRAMGLARRDGVAALPRFYDPIVYRYLKVMLGALNRSAATACFERDAVCRDVRLDGLDVQPAVAAMDALGVESAVRKLLGDSARHEQRRRAVHGWFDAFRTMKFIHHLRDNGIASVDARRALDDGVFVCEQAAVMVRDDIEVVRDARAAGLGVTDAVPNR